MQFQIDSSSFDAFYPEPITPLPTEDIQLFGENVANWIESVCKDNMIGWDMKLVNGFPTFYLFKGRILDGSDPMIQPAPFVKFSPENDNLLTVEYSHTAASNVGLVGGEGEGTSKKTAWSGETSKDGYARNEVYIDGSGVSSNGEIITEATYLSMLKNYGQEQLGQLMKTGTFQGTVDPNVTYKLNQNYKLGDRVLIEAVEAVEETMEAQTEETVAEAAEETVETAETEAEASEDAKEGKGFFKKKEKKDKRDEQIAELNDKVLRQMAEFENFRKRTEKEKAAMFEIGAKSIVEKLLPVIDNFERGLATVSEEEKNGAFAQGIDKIYKQLLTELAEAGVTPIEAVGKEFNPDFHNAVMHIEDENFGENIVAEEFQKGYMYKDSVVRHSMVKVAN